MNCTKGYSIKITSGALPTPDRWWKMEEAAPDAKVDQVVGALLDIANAPPSVPGKILNCVQFSPPSGNSNGLVIHPGDGAAYTGLGVTMAAWWRYEAANPNTQVRFHLLGDVAFFTGIFSFAANFQLFALLGGSTAFAPPSAATWHFFILEFDPATGNMNLEFDRNGTIISTNSPPPAIGEKIGPYCSAQVGAFDTLSWSADEVAIFMRLLTTTERDALYNGGNGVTYPY